jgi:hypothetical protein
MNTRYLELTNTDTSTAIWVRAAHIDAVLDNGAGSTLSLHGLSITVNETYADVLARLRVALQS